MIKLNYMLLCIILFVSLLKLSAHPGWGLVADSKGNFYFTDVVNTTIWKFTNDGELTELYTDKWTHQLDIDSEDNLYIEYEQYINGVHWSGFIKVSPIGEETELIPLTTNDELFLSGNTTMDNQGNIYFVHQNRIYKNIPSAESSVFAGSNEGTADGLGTSAEFSSIFTLNLCNDGNIYIADNGSIRKLTQDGTVTTVARGLLIDNPPDSPFPGINNPAINRIYSVTRDDKGNLYAAYNGNKRVLKISSNGVVEEIYMPSGNWFPIGLTYHNKELYILDECHNSANTVTSLRLVKFSGDGNHEVLTETNGKVTNVGSEDMGAVPTGIKLYNSYPSPFNNSTIIKFEISGSNYNPYVHVHLDVYDTLGKKIETLFHGAKQPGIYEISFNNSKLATGVYYYRLTAGKLSSTKKMVLLR